MTEYIDKKAIRDLLYEEDAITMRGISLINMFPSVNLYDDAICNDDEYISKRDLLRDVKACCEDCNVCGEILECIVESVPIDVAPVIHAHWISECQPYAICSACNHRFDLFDYVPYCPNCGAKMDGDTDEVN